MPKKTKAKKKEVKRCVAMYTDEVSLVTRGANGHKQWLMVKSDGDIGQIVVDSKDGAFGDGIVEQAEARAERSKKYGIEVLGKGSHLEFPEDSPTSERLYGDPVNLRYPLAGEGENTPSVGQIENSMARFRKSFGTYSEKSSQARIYERIMRAAMSKDVKVTIDPNDPVDAILPGDIKTRLSKTNADGPNTGLQSTDSDAADGDNDADVSDWLQGIKKSVDDTDSNDWLSDVSSALKPVEEDQAPDDMNKGDDGGGDNKGDAEGQGEPEPTRKSDDPSSEETGAIDALKKELKASSAKIDELEKAVTSLKAQNARLTTQIGAPSTMRPGEEAFADDDDDDELNSSIDLSPPLE